MQANEAFPIRLERAGLCVRVEQTGSGLTPNAFCVVFHKKGKLQRERFADAAEARRRAEAVLLELVEETFPIELDVSGVRGKIYFTPTGKGGEGYEAFTLTYYQNGKRVREQFGSLEEARRRGKQVLGDLSKGQIEAAGMTMRDRDAYLHALKHLEGTGVSLESACKECAEAFRLLKGVSILHAAREYARRHHGEVVNRTVQQVVDEFLAAKRDGRATRLRGNGRKVSAKYLYELEGRLGAFARRFHMPIGTVSGEEINRFVHGLGWREHRPGRKKTPHAQGGQRKDEEQLRPGDQGVVRVCEETAVCTAGP